MVRAKIENWLTKYEIQALLLSWTGKHDFEIKYKTCRKCLPISCVDDKPDWDDHNTSVARVSAEIHTL